MNLNEALRLVEREANLSLGRAVENRLRSFNDYTETKDWGWVIYYGDGHADMDASNGELVSEYPPYLVNRTTGEVFCTGKAWPTAKYVDDYETRLLANLGQQYNVGKLGRSGL